MNIANSPNNVSGIIGFHNDMPPAMIIAKNISIVKNTVNIVIIVLLSHSIIF